MIQLNPYIPVLTPLGTARAFAYDAGPNDDFASFHVFLDDSHIVCIFKHHLVRCLHNYTEGIFPMDDKETWRGCEEEVQEWRNWYKKIKKEKK